MVLTRLFNQSNLGQITTHYSAAEIGELMDAVEKVSWSGTSAPTLTLINNETSRKSPAGSGGVSCHFGGHIGIYCHHC